MVASPNLLYIGTSKAGSTWIFKALSWHPEIYMYPGKDLNFFTREYDKGFDWYRSNFYPEQHHKIVGEVAHSYLVSEDACNRIRDMLPHVKLLVCLREPVERIFSQYLDGIKNGKFSGDFDFELENTPSLINRSRYGTHLGRYLERFPRENIHITYFDDLAEAPDKFAAGIFDFLGVEPLTIPARLQQKLLPAGQPRLRSIAMATKSLASLTNRIGLAGLRGQAKTSPIIRNLIYKPFEDSLQPKIPPQTEARLRNLMAGELQHLDALAGSDTCRRWNYPIAA